MARRTPGRSERRRKPHNRSDLVDAEAVCLRLGRAVGLMDIDIERAGFGGREVIIVSRFDRVPGEGGVSRRLRPEDLLQALGVTPGGGRDRVEYQRSGSPGPPSWWHAADLLDTRADDLDRCRLVDETVAACHR